MAKISSKRRSFQIKQRHKRKIKLKKLRLLYLEAKTEQEKEKILEKARRISPYLSKEEFLKPIKEAKITKTAVDK